MHQGRRPALVFRIDVRPSGQQGLDGSRISLLRCLKQLLVDVSGVGDEMDKQDE